MVREMEEKSLPKPVVQGITFSLFYKIGRLIKKYEDDPAPFVADLQKEFHLCFSNGEVPFQQWFPEAMRKTGNHIAQLAKKKEPHIIHAILEFIDAHYKEDLSLKRIAGLFFMNSAYLGQLFKQKTGQSFNDTLNKCRISFVKKLIIQHQYMGTESIMEAGFKSVEHFYRQFKRYEGISFSEYKDSVYIRG